MKLGALILVLAIVLGGLVGTLVVEDPGYVLLAYGESAIETSLWFAALLLLGLYFLIRLTMFAFTRSMAGSGRFSSWMRSRKTRRARQQTGQGLLLMGGGGWGERGKGEGVEREGRPELYCVLFFEKKKKKQNQLV